MGILALALGQTSETLIFGLLVVAFTAAAIGGAVIVTVLLGRRARLARLQSDLLANVTHELRTPLSAIRMYAQTLQLGVHDRDPEQARESLAVIVRETQWLETMIDRVLTWRALSKDRDASRMTAAPLGEAVEEAAARFRRMVAPGEVDFALDVQTSAPVLHDPQAIGALVLNLLVNAYKYSGPDKRLRVDLTSEGAEVVLAVEDNGIGIPARERARIFDPFYRVDSRLRSRAAGAGLGLAIVRHVVQTHDGQILVESEEGRGTRFVVQLPVVTSGEDAS